MQVMYEPTDPELWECVLGGDADAFGTLFEKHSEVIYNYCFRRTGNWAKAEDLMYEGRSNKVAVAATPSSPDPSMRSSRPTASASSRRRSVPRTPTRSRSARSGRSRPR